MSYETNLSELYPGYPNAGSTLIETGYTWSAQRQVVHTLGSDEYKLDIGECFSVAGRLDPL